MEVVMPELEICSSFKELSILKSASTGEQGVNGGSMLIHQRIANNRDSDWCNSGSLSSGKKRLLDSRASSAENALKKPLLLGCAKGKALNVFCKGKALVCTSEAEELNERLRILEEETETMKQELFESAEERKKLMHEIYQQFQMLKNDPRLPEFLSTRAELFADCFDAFGG